MKIEDISIFGEYKQAENRVTAAFLQICKVGGEELIRFLANKLSIQLPSSDIEIHSQIQGIGTVPDGLLESNFSFKLYVESKIKPNSVNATQHEGHKRQIKNSTDFLLYLTPDDNKPAILETTYWANWLQIINTFNDYLDTDKIENKQLLDFLIRHFNTLLDNLNLLGHTWDLNNDNAIIVAGSWAEGVALKFNYYICQNNRSFRSARYLAFFNNNTIRYVFEISKPPENDIDLKTRPEFAAYLKLAEPGYNGEKRKVFTLINARNVGPILNDNLDKNGNPCPYTYGQPRYTKIQNLVSAIMTSQL
jgi:hypothetical protein